ncbi:MAG: class I SAM-dependent methyltransferase [Treponema sp.]|jgi:2-polyprenyl-3-methyl-5-hydroxy-6-metoxy-1,4-benzoquinol methylase|nr:class I SAM-dependent methyltransferase [Treponema sp.]
MDEKERLEKIAENSIYCKGINALAQQYCVQIFMRYLKKGSILELGPAEGIMTDILYPLYPQNYTVVDGSSVFINSLKQRYPSINAVESIFEEFDPDIAPPVTFDNIILGHVLEHVTDPVAILMLCKKWLKDDGVILSAVPNKNSIHRHAAVEMGLLSKLDDFSEKDKHHGHRRVFELNDFLKTFEQAELKILAKGGYWLKPISDAQIESQWTNSMIQAFFKLGELYPDIAAEIYAIAAK